MNVLTPYEEVPTESLYFSSPQQSLRVVEQPKLPSPSQGGSISSMSSGGLRQIATENKSAVIRAELDVQTKGRILTFIQNRENGVTTVKEPPPSISTDMEENGHTSSFYIPPPQTSSGSRGVGLLERFTGLVGLKPRCDVQTIDKETLMKYRVTICDLLESCQVRLSDMRQAGILTSFSDLMDLHFCVEDLTRRPLLFSCQSLVQVFKASYKTLVEHGITFDVSHLLRCKFKPQDLVALAYSLDPLICEGGINKDHLRTLNFSLRDLVALGFRSEHLKILKISRNLATTAYPVGFGWAPEELGLIVDVSKIKK
jgi:hypothetical protein